MITASAIEFSPDITVLFLCMSYQAVSKVLLGSREVKLIASIFNLYLTSCFVKENFGKILSQFGGYYLDSYKLSSNLLLALKLSWLLFLSSYGCCVSSPVSCALTIFLQFIKKKKSLMI